jgi:hypothetical protein
MVDHDVDMQMTSRIWGHKILIANKEGTGHIFGGDFQPVTFLDICKRNEEIGGDVAMSSIYKSLLTNTELYYKQYDVPSDETCIFKQIMDFD